MIRNPEDDKLIGALFTLKNGSTKFVKNMSYNQDKEDLDRAIELLKEAYDKLQNDYYGGWSEWECTVRKFLKEIKENDSRETK